jgi:uncharacterized protein (TIGR03437 family)
MLRRLLHGAAAVCLAVSAAYGQIQFRNQRATLDAEHSSRILVSEAGFRAAGCLGAALPLRVRASADRMHWSNWRTPEPDGEASALVFFGELQHYLEVEAGTEPGPGAAWLLIDPGVTPKPPTRPRKPPSTAVPVPPIVSRAEWGCTPATCPVTDPPAYTTVTHLIVHHTATGNNATDWAAVVRSIWVLHVQGNGWNDIGYNYLIDPNGVLYEGRAGGAGVMGAHFSCVNGGTIGVAVLGTYSYVPSPDAANAMLEWLLAWQAAKWSLDPSGKSLHAASGLMLDVISGHRDANLSALACGGTSCPGNGLYPLLPELRREVAQQVAGACPVNLTERLRCVSAAGEQFLEPVITPAGCGWLASTNASWISASWIPATSTSMAASLNVAANSGARRTAAVTIDGHVLTVVQAAQGEGPLPCPAVGGIESAGLDSARPVVAGSLVSIFGSNLAAQETSSSTSTLPVELGGVSVAIDGRAVPLLYAGPNQINAQIPPATNVGSARAVVTSNGVTGPELDFSVTEAVPAIFIWNGRAVAQNYDDGTVNGPDAPVRPGGVLTVYLTGVGPVEGTFPAAGTPAPMTPLVSSLPWSATIGGQDAGPLFLELMPAGVGVYQSNLLVPADLAAGDYDLAITVSGASSLPAKVSVGGQ